MRLSTRMTEELSRLADRAANGWPTTLIRKTDSTFKALERRGLVKFVPCAPRDPVMVYARLTDEGVVAANRVRLGDPVTREWSYTLGDGRVMTASVRLVPHTNPAHVPRNPSDRYTVYTDTPGTFNHTTHSTRKGAMEVVQRFTERMDAREIMVRTK